jgi:hypothetical protein
MTMMLLSLLLATGLFLVSVGFWIIRQTPQVSLPDHVPPFAVRRPLRD